MGNLFSFYLDRCDDHTDWNRGSTHSMEWNRMDEFTVFSQTKKLNSGEDRQIDSIA